MESGGGGGGWWMVVNGARGVYERRCMEGHDILLRFAL